MNVLLDHCVPRPLARLLVAHDVDTARRMGWDDLNNGELMSRAADEFDVPVTIDRNLMHQQDRGDLPLPVIVMISADSRIEALALLVPEVLAILNQELVPRVYVVPEDATDSG